MEIAPPSCPRRWTNPVEIPWREREVVRAVLSVHKSNQSGVAIERTIDEGSIAHVYDTWRQKFCDAIYRSFK